MDLMDPVAREKLATSAVLGPQDAHAYAWGAVYWNLPIKVTAQVPIFGGGTWFTHDGQTRRQPMGGDYVATTFLLDLAFDPDALVKAATRGSPQTSLTDEARTMSVPMLDLTPLPHRDSEKLMRETYVASVATGGESFRFRLSLYSLEGDPSRVIYGASTRTVQTAETRGFVSDAQKVSFMASKEGKLVFQGWDKSSLVSGFTRGEKEGDETTATLHCGTHGPSGGSAAVLFEACPQGGTTVTFRLVSVGPPLTVGDQGATRAMWRKLMAPPLRAVRRRR